MTQPAVLLILPTSRNPDEETDAIQTTQSLEDLRLAERIEAPSMRPAIACCVTLRSSSTLGSVGSWVKFPATT